MKEEVTAIIADELHFIKIYTAGDSTLGRLQRLRSDTEGLWHLKLITLDELRELLMPIQNAINELLKI